MEVEVELEGLWGWWWGGGGGEDEADAVSRVGVPWKSGGKLKGGITYKPTRLSSGRKGRGEAADGSGTRKRFFARSFVKFKMLCG